LNGNCRANNFEFPMYPELITPIIGDFLCDT
jgi:hypothetical protein